MKPEKQSRFLWLDVETTGLDPHKDLLLEVACWASQSSNPFDLADDAMNLVIRHPGVDLAHALSPVTWQMHSRNGLLGDVVNAERNLDEVAEVLSVYVANRSGHPDGVIWHLAGNSVHFDLGFLRVHTPGFAKLLSHRIYDVSSLALAARAQGMPHDKADPAHRALDDVRASIRQAHAVVSWMRDGHVCALPTRPNGMQLI